MLRPYQIELANQGAKLLKELHIVYYSIEMRVGKTLIALETARLRGCRNVLFVTKKIAMESIGLDFAANNFNFNLKVINYEQLDKIKPEYDCIIADEAHGCGAYPKASLRTKRLKEIVGQNYLILLSGTPSPESYSQLFHQFGLSYYTPFPEGNFYKWARSGYVNVKEKIYSGVKHNDYDDANKDLIWQVVGKYFISYTRQQAGFKQTEVFEQVVTVPVEPMLQRLIDWVIKEKYYKFKDGNEIICDSAVKVQSKVHQLFSGTVKTETGEAKILDRAKAEFISVNYQNQRIAVYYKFIAEGQALREALAGQFTDNPIMFDKGKYRVFLSQIQSGSMGINLASADILIFYNIDFSAMQYWQARARLQALDRETTPLVHWLFSMDGIENKILKVVQDKKDYTLNYFMKDYGNGYHSKKIRNGHPGQNQNLFETQRSLGN